MKMKNWSWIVCVLILGSVALMGCPPIYPIYIIDIFDGENEIGINRDDVVYVHGDVEMLIYNINNGDDVDVEVFRLDIEDIEAKTFEGDDMGLLVVGAGIGLLSELITNGNNDEYLLYEIPLGIGEGVRVVVSIPGNGTVFFNLINATEPPAEGEGEAPAEGEGEAPAEGEVIVQYTLEVSVRGNGTASGAGTYDAGTVVLVDAEAAIGWSFVHWEIPWDDDGDGEDDRIDIGTDSPHAQVTMGTNIRLVAVFSEDEPEPEGEGEGESEAPQEYTLTLEYTGSGSIYGDGTFNAGEERVIMATPDPGWHFVRWEGTISGTSNPATVTMNSNIIAIAVFEENETPAEGEGEAPQRYTLTLDVSGDGSVHGAGTYNAGEERIIMATPDPGWHFVRWEGTVSGTYNPATVTMDSDILAIAVFEEDSPLQYTLTLATNGNGSASGGGTSNAGEERVIVATPDTGWHFVRWEGDITGTDNSATVTMDSDVHAIAVFEENETPAEGEGEGEAPSDDKIHVDMTWDGTELVFSASEANPGQIGLELYHQVDDGSGVWIERQVFTVDADGNTDGVISVFRPNIFRFEVVNNDNVGGYISLSLLDVTINTLAVSRENDGYGNIAFQVDVSAL